MKGIIISEDTFSDERIKLIESMPNGDETLIIFFKLLSLACKSNAGGFLLLTREIPYNDEMLAAIFGRSLQSVKFALKTLEGFGMIRESEEGFQVENFLDWMAPEDKAREQARIRMQKHRETKKELPAPDADKTEEPKKKPSRKMKQYEEDSQEMILARYLLKKINEHSPEYPEPTNWNRWADDMRLIMQRKKKTPEQIKNLIDWVHSHQFWYKNILSASKLKEKYDDLLVQARDDWEKKRFVNKNAGSQKGDIFKKFREEKNNGC